MIVIIENVTSSANPMTIVADMILLLCTCLNITYALATPLFICILYLATSCTHWHTYMIMCNVVYTHDQ